MGHFDWPFTQKKLNHNIFNIPQIKAFSTNKGL